MKIGTTNPSKIREIGACCLRYGIEVTTISLDVPETEDSFEGNARLKALAYSKACPGEYVLVEDSGLVIPALNGLPGPWSARFHGLDLGSRSTYWPKAALPLSVEHPLEEVDRLNRDRVLRLMDNVPFGERGAYFIITMMVAKDGEVVFKTSAESHGHIAPEERGTTHFGFGYDSIFIGNDTFGKTYAELDPARKQLRSHRGRALEQFEAWLSQKVREGLKL
jgi:XTP/dITP diphosphohydrolase